MTKVCSKCGVEKDVSEYYKRSHSKDGKSPSCKKCQNLYTLEYYNKNLRHDTVYIQMEKTCKQCGKKFITVSAKAMYCSNACKAENYRDRNQKKVRASADKYSKKKKLKKNIIKSLYNIIYIKECLYCGKIFISNNKNQRNCSDRCRINKSKKNRYNNNVEYKLIVTLRGHINMRLRKGIIKSKKTIELTGCDISELKQHLEKQFTEGMTWDNHGYYGWHIDHIRPCASFDLTDPEQQKQCFHYTNLQPLWAKDNLAKSDKWDGMEIRT